MKLMFTPKAGTLLSGLFLFLFSFQLQAQVPSNNECSGAIDLSSLFGQPVNMTVASGTFDNTMATSEASDPTTGFDCFAEPNYNAMTPIIENTLWFSFVGDGNGYFIETGDCGSTNYISGGDTQIAIYTGSCGNYTPVACNEDGPNATNTDFKAGVTLETMDGVTYYMLIDGFNFNSTGVASGEFCIEVTQVDLVTCADIHPGTVTSFDQFVCFNNTTAFTIDSVVIPTSLPNTSGFRWAISAGDISGSMDPGGEAGYVGAFGQSPVPYTPSLINDGTQLPTNTLVYFTPIAYAGAVDTVGNGFLESLDFSGGCVATGTSIPVILLGDNGPIATTPYTQGASMMPFDGQAGVDISGGSGIYNVLWNTGATTDTITGLAPGDYSVTVQDVSGCVDSLVTTITVADDRPRADVTFNVDFKDLTNPSAMGAYIAGEFNNWTGEPMTAAGTDVYTFTTSLLIGDTVEYKFQNGPGVWEEGIPSDCSMGATGNRYVMVPATALVLPEVCWQSCVDCIDVGTFSPEFEAAVSLFPNPASQTTFIEFNFNESTDLTIQLTSLTGQVIREETVASALVGRSQLELKDVVPGVYFVQIRDAKNLLTKRLIVK